MTNQEKIQIWEALYKCTRNGYPGATYQEYDTPKDPRVRGGRWNWTYHQLRDLYEQLVKWGEANEPTAAWRELEKYKNKIPPACLRSIYQSITFLPPGLVLTFDDIVNVPVANPANVSDWNTFFNFPSSGNAFTSVIVSGSVVTLIGGSNVTMKVGLFATNDHIITVDDTAECVVGIKDNCFGKCSNLVSVFFPAALIVEFAAFGKCTNLETVNLPKVVTMQDQVFLNCLNLREVLAPFCLTVGSALFDSDNLLTTIDLTSCTNFGGTVGDDFIFNGTSLLALTLTIDSSRATCNAGGEDGDIAFLRLTSPAATIIYV